MNQLAPYLDSRPTEFPGLVSPKPHQTGSEASVSKVKRSLRAGRGFVCPSGELGEFLVGGAGALRGRNFAAHQSRDLERDLESERRRLVRFFPCQWFTRFRVRSVSGVQCSLLVFNTVITAFANVARVVFRLTGSMSLNFTNISGIFDRPTLCEERGAAGVNPHHL